MWAFFSKRLRMWLILAVGVPLAGLLLGKVADVLESRRGPSGISTTLRNTSGWLKRQAKGPLAKRGNHAASPQPGAPVR